MQPLADERQMRKVDGWLPMEKANVHPNVNDVCFAGQKVASAACIDAAATVSPTGAML